MPEHRKRVVGGRAPQLNFMVTEEIIATAVPKDSGRCMISDSLKAAMPQARGVESDLATIRFTDQRNGRRYIYLTPIPAQVALLDFDKGERPEPFRIQANAAQIIEPLPKREKRSSTSDDVTPGSAFPEAPVEFPAVVSSSFSEALAESPTAVGSAFPETPDSAPERSEPPSSSSFPEAPVESNPPRQSPRLAYLMPNPAGGGTIPIKVNGSPPPVGQLAHGQGIAKLSPKYRTGRLRGFGLRVMGR